MSDGGEGMKDWWEFYMGLAFKTAEKSKDPSTRVGAVIMRPDRTVASIGYNGFPRRVRDDPARYQDRAFKLAAVVHAELNAILNAREILRGCTMISTFHPCAQCAAAIVQTGIARVIAPSTDIPERWAENMAIASTILMEGGVAVHLLEPRG